MTVIFREEEVRRIEGEVFGQVSHSKLVAALEQGRFQVPRPDGQGTGRPGPPDQLGALLQPRARERGAGADKHSQRHIRSACTVRPARRPGTQVCCGKPWGAERKSLGEHVGN